jgi:hypothetical protein
MKHKIVLFIVAVVLFTIGCQTLAPTPTPTSTSTPLPSPTSDPTYLPPIITPTFTYNKIIYSTGIEVERMPTNNVLAITDRDGEYMLAFPENWDVGPFTEEFSSLDTYLKINPAAQFIFSALLAQQQLEVAHFRIFAVDISPGHLTDKYFSVIHISTTTDSGMLKHSLEELAQMNWDSSPHDQNSKLAAKVNGVSAFDIPYLYIEIKTGSTSSGAMIYAKTSKSVIQVSYITSNPNITISKELSLIAGSIADIAK